MNNLEDTEIRSVKTGKKLKLSHSKKYLVRLHNEKYIRLKRMREIEKGLRDEQ
jgi:hypothetical protein